MQQTLQLMIVSYRIFWDLLSWDNPAPCSPRLVSPWVVKKWQDHLTNGNRSGSRSLTLLWYFLLLLVHVGIDHVRLFSSNSFHRPIRTAWLHFSCAFSYAGSPPKPWPFKKKSKSAIPSPPAPLFSASCSNKLRKGSLSGSVCADSALALKPLGVWWSKP
jgi:hypothetical protein